MICDIRFSLCSAMSERVCVMRSLCHLGWQFNSSDDILMLLEELENIKRSKVVSAFDSCLLRLRHACQQNTRRKKKNKTENPFSGCLQTTQDITKLALWASSKPATFFTIHFSLSLAALCFRSLLSPPSMLTSQSSLEPAIHIEQ